MSKAFIFLTMIFLHIIDDYCLQGILASMKQKEWWNRVDDEGKKTLEPLSHNKYDYIWALIMHSFSWSFMIMLPLAYKLRFRNISIAFILIFSVNVLIHAVTDHAKANMKKLNLWQDQIIHLVQITATFILFNILY